MANPMGMQHYTTPFNDPGSRMENYQKMEKIGEGTSKTSSAIIENHI